MIKMKIKQTNSGKKELKNKFSKNKPKKKTPKDDAEGKPQTDIDNQLYNELNFVDVGESCELLDEVYFSVDCHFCHKDYNSKARLNQHILKKHKQQLETCDLCRVSFYNKSILGEHRSKHITRKENVYKCSLCPQAFFNRSRLIDHESKHGNDRDDNGLLLENDNIHSVVLPTHSNEYIGFENTFPCDLCSKSFKVQLSLDRHRLTHTKVKVTNCKNCKEADANSTDTNVLQNHENQSILKFLHCNYCGKVFVNGESLEKHVAVHEQNEKKKKYACKYCQKRYLVPAMLFTHFRKIHKMEKPFVCLYCDQSFSKRQEFSLHIKSIHENTGNIRFDEDFSIVYGTILMPTNAQNQSIAFDINNSSLDGCFPETRFLDVNTDDFIDLDSSNLEEISLDTDCFNAEKSDEDDILNIITSMNNRLDDKNFIVFNDDILDILESAKTDDMMKENSESVIPMEEVLVPVKIKDVSKSPKTPKDSAKSKGKAGETIECDVCGVNLKKNSAKSHLSQHYNKTFQKFKCYLCPMHFRTKIKLDLHVKNHFVNDKKLCICGVQCDTDENMKKHRKQCFKSFLSIGGQSVDSEDSDMDPLNDDSIVIFDAEQSACLVLKDSTENRKYVKNARSVEAIRDSLDAIPPSSSYMQPSPLLFRRPIESPSPKVIVKRITQEEAATKRKTFIKTTLVEHNVNQSTAEISIYQHPAAEVSPQCTENDDRILVNVNPLAHLFPVQQNFLKKKFKVQRLDYASIIEKSLNDILHVKKSE